WALFHFGADRVAFKKNCVAARPHAALGPTRHSKAAWNWRPGWDRRPTDRPRRSVPLAPELIHPGECIGAVPLECIPARQIGHRLVVGKFRPIISQYARIQFESDERQFLRVAKFLDLRNGEPVLLDVEQQIAASAGAEEIGI